VENDDNDLDQTWMALKFLGGILLWLAVPLGVVLLLLLR
jgi:hypothetical protein